jgi:NAD(P)-dependent dehydrogenase (short-subunit alcohol dehydrogenase family)
VTKQFSGKVALVTGGSAGIGRATTIAFAKEGAKVVIAARREKESEALLAEIRCAGSEGLYVHTDATEVKDLTAMVEKTVATYGRLDFAFNNAGVEEPLTPLAERPRRFIAKSWTPTSKVFCFPCRRIFRRCSNVAAG